MSGRWDSQPEADAPLAQNPRPYHQTRYALDIDNIWVMSGRWDSQPDADAPLAQNPRSYHQTHYALDIDNTWVMSGRWDSNPRPLGPEPSALTGLSHAP